MVEVVQGLTVAELADVLDEMEPDMAGDLIGELGEVQAAALLDEMEAVGGVTPLLAYPEDSAGGIMNSPPHMLRRQMTVADAMQFLRVNITTTSTTFTISTSSTAAKRPLPMSAVRPLWMKIDWPVSSACGHLYWQTRKPEWKTSWIRMC